MKCDTQDCENEGYKTYHDVVIQVRDAGKLPEQLRGETKLLVAEVHLCTTCDVTFRRERRMNLSWERILEDPLAH